VALCLYIQKRGPSFVLEEREEMRDSLPDISLCILYMHFKRTAIIRSDIYTPSYRLGGGRMKDVGYGGGGGGTGR
jgi:hypothetical protein